MAFAPQQDWDLFEARSRNAEAQRMRSLSPHQRFEIYRDFFDVVWTARQNQGNHQRLDRWVWDQKLADRRRMVEAFTKLDQFKREKSAADNAR